jgi:hypothetical protein
VRWLIDFWSPGLRKSSIPRSTTSTRVL